MISPAKRLDWSDRPLPCGAPAPTRPVFEAEAGVLADIARTIPEAGLQRLMSISADLARLNHARFARFASPPSPEAVRPAALAFAGDTYAGLEARTLDADALRWAQDRLRILSGIYGVLRPLDLIQPYRLEMGSRLANPRGGDLYAWWGGLIARALSKAAAASATDTLINCASVEYFGAVRPEALRLRIITPVFLEDRPEGPRIISFHAKKARGAMARFIVENRLTEPDAIRDFDIGGYRHEEALSEGDRWAFLRSMS